MTAQTTSVANAFETTLTAAVTDGDLTFPVGTVGVLTSPCYLVIDPDNPTKREYVLFDGTFTATDFVTTSTANRGLTGSASGAQSHSKGAKVRSSPMAQHINDLNDRVDLKATTADVVTLAGAQTITGAKTFSTDPTLADGSSALSLTEGNAAYRFALAAKDYGAVADGVTDDSAAILAAKADLPTDASGNKVGWIMFDAGDYYLGTTSIPVDGFMGLFCPGKATRFIYEGTGTADSAAILVNGVTGSGKNTQGFSLYGFKVDCNGLGDYGVKIGQTGLGDKSAGGLVESVHATGAAVGGWNLVAAQLVTFVACRAEANSGDGWHMARGAANTDCTFIGLRTYNNTGRGFHLEQGSQVVFVKPSFESNGLEGLHVVQSATDEITTVVVDQPRFESNNNGRGAGGHAQCRIESSVADAIDGFELRTPHYSNAGTGNVHNYWHGVNLKCRDPQAVVPTVASTSFATIPAVGTSATDVEVWHKGAFGPTPGTGVTGRSWRSDGPNGLILSVATGAAWVNALRVDDSGDVVTARKLYGSWVTFTDLATTPSVGSGNRFVVSNSAATTVTNLADGVDGQEVTLLFTNANTTLQDAASGGSFQLAGSTNHTPNFNDVMRVIKRGAVWYEIGRSDN